MTDQSQKTKKSTDEQSISTSRRSALSSMGAGVAALGVGVGSIDTAKATYPSALPTDPNDWSTEHGSVINPTPDGVELAYNENEPGEQIEYSTTATKTEDTNLKWELRGNHGFGGADVGASISVNNDTTYLVGPNKDVSGDFREKGELTLSLSEGDTVTAKVGGDEGGYRGYHGELILTPLHTHPDHGPKETPEPEPEPEPITFY